MFDAIEYVDPADSMCEECRCSFGIHLKTCSKFIDPHAKPVTPQPQEGGTPCRRCGLPLEEFARECKRGAYCLGEPAGGMATGDAADTFTCSGCQSEFMDGQDAYCEECLCRSMREGRKPSLSPEIAELVGRLRITATKAEIGEWQVVRGKGGNGWTICSLGDDRDGNPVSIETMGVRGSQLRCNILNDAEYFAEASPENILKICDTLEGKSL